MIDLRKRYEKSKFFEFGSQQGCLEGFKKGGELA